MVVSRRSILKVIAALPLLGGFATLIKDEEKIWKLASISMSGGDHAGNGAKVEYDYRWMSKNGVEFKRLIVLDYPHEFCYRAVKGTSVGFTAMEMTGAELDRLCLTS